MSNTMVKRAVSLAAAFSMIFVLLLSGMQVKAASVDFEIDSIEIAPSGVTAGGSFTATVNLTGYTGTATPIEVTVSGLGGLSNSYSEDVTFTDTKASIAIPAGKLYYSGSGTAQIGVTIDTTTKSKSVDQFFTPTDTDDGGGGSVAPSKPTGNLIGVKSGVALPEIKAGETKTIEIPLTSTGLNSRYAGKTQVTASLPEGIYFNTATSMQELNFSRTGKDQTLKLSISADSAAKSGVFPITLKSVYKYSGQEVTEELQINLKVNGKTETEENGGLSVIDYSLDKKSVKAGAGFKLTLTIKNTGNTECQNVKVLLDGLNTEGITVNGGMDTQNIPSLTPGSSVSLSYDLITSKEMVTGNHILTANASCGEITGSSKVFVPIEGKPSDKDDEEKPKSSKPRVVIDSYTFANMENGEVVQENATSVEGGKTFRLNLNMKNTNTATAIENLKMTITSVSDETTGGVFTPANASNTFFISKVGAGESFSEVIDLLVKADAPPKSYGLQVAVSYEAVVDKERVTVDDTETITIPVTQPDRFEVEEVNVWGPVMYGETIQPSLSYVNKGKSSIYNLTIKIEGTNFTTGESTNYVGNVESGSGDYYEASLNAEAPGTVEGKFIISYEDAAGNLKELERAFSVEVQEMNMEDPGMMDPVGPIEPEPTGLPMWVWIVIGVGGAAVIAAAVIIVIKIKKKKAAKKQDEEDDYDD